MLSSFKLYQSGTHRVIPPSQTLERISVFTKDMGITRLANITGLDTLGISVYMACRPNSRSLAVSQGKGITSDAAKVSALMEAIESYHAERIDLPLKILSYNDISLHNNMADISKFSKLSNSGYNQNVRIPWIQGRDLLSNELKWLPYECVHTDYTHPFSYNHGHFISDTNGLASGNTLDEAINHGIYEVVERDALAIWSLNRKDQKYLKKVDLETVSIPFIRKVLEKIHESKVYISIWDITTDTKIPTYICKIIQGSLSHNSIRPAYGSGTHLSKNVALLRAVTEAAQSRLTFIAGSRDDQYVDIYREQFSQERHERWLDEVRGNGDLDFMKSNTYETASMYDDQIKILDALKEIGIEEVINVDLTSQKFMIPVVKVIIPGLEGISYPGKRILGARGKKFFQVEGTGACHKTL